MEKPSGYISVREASRRTGLHEDTIRRWVDAYIANPESLGQLGTLKGVKSPKRSGRGQERWVDEQDTERIVRAMRPPAPGPAGAHGG